MNTLIIVIIVLIIVILAIGAVTVWLATKPPTKTVCSNVVYTGGVVCTTTNNVTTCSPDIAVDVNTSKPLVDLDSNNKLTPAAVSCPSPGSLTDGVCTIPSSITCGSGTVLSGTSCTANLDTDATAKVDPTSGMVVAAVAACGTGTQYQGDSFTCTSTPPGATCPQLTAGVKTVNNTVVPDLGSNTVVDPSSHKVVPTNNVCPSGSTLDTTTYTCSAVPTTSCPTPGAGVVLSSDKKSYVANLIDNNVMVDATTNKIVIDTNRIANPLGGTYAASANDKVIWRDNQCQSTCPSAGKNVVLDNQTNAYVPNDQVCPPNSQLNNTTFVCSAPPQDCTACDLSKSSKSAADPATWVTCSSSACQGSLTMTQKAACDKQIGQTKLSTVPGTLGVDVAGMFDCLAGTSACQYGDLIAACKTSSSSPACTSFTVNSNADNETMLATCAGTKTDNTSNAVAFAPFGNNIAPAPKTQSLGRTAAKRKLPGWD